jgi:hypothetical protein
MAWAVIGSPLPLQLFETHHLTALRRRRRRLTRQDGADHLGIQSPKPDAACAEA